MYMSVSLDVYLCITWVPGAQRPKRTLDSLELAWQTVVPGTLWAARAEPTPAALLIPSFKYKEAKNWAGDRSIVLEPF